MSLKSSFEMDIERAIENSLREQFEGSTSLYNFGGNSIQSGSLPSLSSRTGFTSVPDLYTTPLFSTTLINNPPNPEQNQFLTSNYIGSPSSYSVETLPPISPIYSSSGNDNLLNYRSPSLLIESPQNSQASMKFEEKSEEELELSALRRSKIEEVTQLLRRIETPLSNARKIMEQKQKEYLEAQENFNVLNESYQKYESELENSSNIIEHQDILKDRGLLKDKYDIDVSPLLGNEDVEDIEENKSPKSIEDRFKEMENIGTPVRLRLVFPDNRRCEFITGSMQTFGIITEYASEKYGKPLRLSGIPGVNLSSERTLEDSGFKDNALLRFYS